MKTTSSHSFLENLSSNALPTTWENQVNSVFEGIKTEFLQYLENHKQNAKKKLFKLLADLTQRSRASSSEDLNTLQEKIRKAKIKMLENERIKLECFVDEQKINNSLSGIKSSISHLSDSFHVTIKWQKIKTEGTQLSSLNLDKMQRYKEILVRSGVSGDSIEYIPQQKVLVIGDKMGYFSICETRSYKKLSTIKAFYKPITAVAYSVRTNNVYIASEEAAIKAYRFTNRGTVRFLGSYKGVKPINSIIPLDHINTLVASVRESPLLMLNLTTLLPRGEIEFREPRVSGQLLYIHKYDLIATGFDAGIIGMYDIWTQSEYCTTKTGYEDWYVNSLCYVDKEDTLFASVTSRKVLGWKFNYSRRRLEPHRSIKIKGFSVYTMLPINYDRDILISCGLDKLFIYNIEKNSVDDLGRVGQEITVFKALPQKGVLVLATMTGARCLIISYS